MVDHPGYQQNQGIDFNAIISGGTGANRSDASQRLQDQAQTARDQNNPVQKPQDSVKIGTDATNTVIITNKILELNYNDPNFDTKLNYAGQNGAKLFDQIKIDNLPPGSVMHTWMDQKGYYIWTTDNPKGKHYLPDNALGLMANNAKIDLEKERLKDNEAFAKQNFGGFQNFDRNWVPARDGGVNSTNYYLQIANASGPALDIQAHALRESVRSSDNPYFKIYLSDIEAAQALKYSRDNHQPIQNEYSRAKLEESLSLSQAAYTQTKEELGQYNQFPAANIYLPLAAERPFWDRNKYRDDYMGFWGGAFNQSYGRAAALQTLHSATLSNFVPQQPHRVPNPRPANPSY